MIDGASLSASGPLLLNDPGVPVDISSAHRHLLDRALELPEVLALVPGKPIAEEARGLFD
jgi:hypothetical protein